MKHRLSALIILSSLVMFSSSACSAAGTNRNSKAVLDPTPTQTQTQESASSPQPFQTPSPTLTATITPDPTATEVVFEVGKELTIDYLSELEISGSSITFHERLSSGANYSRHLVSYQSEGNRIYGLLTIPTQDPPPEGFKAVVFNHGYIPPASYRTLERYTAYVDALARSGLVVFKIDFRGHGESEGIPTGSYFSPAYTVDAISALKSLQTLEVVDPQGIGMWGHSMAGNLILRAMLIEPEVKAGVIWAGAVYSYEDFSRLGISDTSYRPPATPENGAARQPRRSSRLIFETYGRPDLDQPFWLAVSLTEHLEYLSSPLQIHHALDDPVVDIGYSYGLAEQLQLADKPYELYIYEGGGHNIISPYFDQAMERTVQFFQDNL